MRLSVLRCTQLILSAMDSDEVNSIDDTTEAQQVVDQLELAYYEVLSHAEFTDQWDFFELDPSNDADLPTVMYVPNNIGKIEWIKYDTTDDGVTEREFTAMVPQEREEFIEMMNKLDTDESNVFTYDLSANSGTFPMRGYNDKNPERYMTFGSRTIVFDSFDLSIGQTLQGNRTWCYGNIVPVFERDDDFIPEFDVRTFSLFFNEAMSASFEFVKQMPSAKAEQRARRAWNHIGRKVPKVPAGEIYHDYTYDFGRRR